MRRTSSSVADTNRSGASCLAQCFNASLMNSGPFSTRNRFGAAHLDEFVQDANDVGRWQVAVDVDLHRLPVEVIVDVEGAKTPVRPTRIGHEADGPGVIGGGWSFQRFPDPFR